MRRSAGFAAEPICRMPIQVPSFMSSGIHTGIFLTKVNGTMEAPITVEGDGTAVLIGSSLKRSQSCA